MATEVLGVLPVVVDDDPEVLWAFSEGLRRNGYPHTFAVASAADCIRLLRQMGSEARGHSVVVLDVNLGPADEFSDGCHAGRVIVRTWPEVRTLYITGFDDQRLERCPGYPTVLMKPFTGERLAEMVRYMAHAPAWQPPAEHLIQSRRKSDEQRRPPP